MHSLTLCQFALWHVCDSESVFLSLFSSLASSKRVSLKASVENTKEEWKEQLFSYVLRQEGPERPCASPLNNVKNDDTFRVVEMQGTRHVPLFTMPTKFDWGSGQPSNYSPVDEEARSLCTYIFGIAAGVVVQKYFTRDSRSQCMELAGPLHEQCGFGGRIRAKWSSNSSRNEGRSHCNHNNYGLLRPLICVDNTLTSR